jgi:hypothetical protein
VLSAEDKCFSSGGNSLIYWEIFYQMNAAALKLWSAIRDFELDDETSSFTFSDRLAKENGWTREFTFRAIEEYKKFMFLVCITNQPLSPSDQVDQVWHLHLLYTQSYWKDFCSVVLEREVHHGPTKGGAGEERKFTDWYSRTLYYYKEQFGADPPADLWPDANLRFKKTNFRRVDLQRNWIIKNPFR